MPEMTSSRIETGDRVRSNDGFDPVPHEGVVQSIAIGCTLQGPAPILRILVDKRGDQTVEPHLYESAAGLWGKVLEDGGVAAQPKPAPTGVKCPSCGEVHAEDPFTPEMYTLFERLKGVASDEEREVILVELAHRFMEQTRETDHEMPDWVHKLVDKVDDAEVRLSRAVLRIGRMVARNFSEMEKQKAVQGHIRKVMLMPLNLAPDEKKGGLN